jgi:hypothetical protein
VFNFLFNYANFRKKIELIRFYIQYFKYQLEDSEPGTFVYIFLHSNFYHWSRIFFYIVSVSFILMLFAIYKFVKERESLIVFIYIIWFFSSLFYIEFIRV